MEWVMPQFLGGSKSEVSLWLASFQLLESDVISLKSKDVLSQSIAKHRIRTIWNSELWGLWYRTTFLGPVDLWHLKFQQQGHLVTQFKCKEGFGPKRRPSNYKNEWVDIQITRKRQSDFIQGRNTMHNWQKIHLHKSAMNENVIDNLLIAWYCAWKSVLKGTQPALYISLWE